MLGLHEPPLPLAPLLPPVAPKPATPPAPPLALAPLAPPAPPLALAPLAPPLPLLGASHIAQSPYAKPVDDAEFGKQVVMPMRAAPGQLQAAVAFSVVHVSRPSGSPLGPPAPASASPSGSPAEKPSAQPMSAINDHAHQTA